MKNLFKVFCFTTIVISNTYQAGKASLLEEQSDYKNLNIYQKTTSKEETETKIKKYLQKDPAIENYYSIDNNALILYSSPQNKNENQPEYIMMWGNNPIHKNTTQFVPQNDPQKPLKGLKVAIDPVGIGGQMAQIERRLITLKSGKQTETQSNIQLDTGALNFITAEAIKELLCAYGAEVFLTREQIGQAAYEKDFEIWLDEYLENKNSEVSDKKLLTTLSIIFRDPQVLLKKFKTLLSSIVANPQNTDLYLKTVLFQLMYNQLDMAARAEKINSFKPHLTIGLLYNNIGGKNIKTNEYFGTTKNFSVNFIPGSIMKGELNEQRYRYAFARLAITSDIEKSIALAKCITDNLEKSAGVKPAKHPTSDSSYQITLEKDNIIKICNGIFCRNLAMTKSVQSPICYSLPLCLDNFDECEKLSSTTTMANRIQDVAQAYFNAVCDFISYL